MSCAFARGQATRVSVAVFVGIEEDDGGDSDWVAGVALGTNARVRLVAPEGIELQ